MPLHHCFSPARRPLPALPGAAVVLVLAGCAVGPRYSMPDPTPLTPAAYATSDPAVSSAPPADRWWNALGDRTLDALVELALADNPDLASAEARVQQTRAMAQVAGAAFYPVANLAAQSSRNQLSRNSENLALIPFTPKTTLFTDYRVGVDASWEIDLAGKTRRDVEAAVARLGSASESRNDARLVVAAEVADAYVDYRAGAERLALARRTAASLGATLHLVALEEEAGIASQTERRRADADRLAAASAIPPLEAQMRSALTQLAALTGQRSEAVAGRLAGHEGIPVVPGSTPVGMPSEILRRRPDVRRAERDLAAATADIGGAVAAQFPRLSLVGDVGWDSVRSGVLTSAASRYWDIAPQLTLPLFAGGRLKGNVRAAEAARDAALASYRSAVLQAFADTESSLIRYSAERSREASLAATAQTLEAALALERRRYGAGDASMIDVLAAERAVTQAWDEQAASRAQLARDYVALGKALGGGWQAAAPSAEQPPGAAQGAVSGN